MWWGSPEFVLTFLGMAMTAGVIRHWISAVNGVPEKRRGRRHFVEHADQADQAVNARLREENERLKQRLEASEDRLAALEKIVTDPGFELAKQIESLRDPAPGRDRMEGELSR